MVTNNAAKRFSKLLMAAFSQYPIPIETRDMYERQLVKWKLSQEEWDRALNYLVENHVKLPSINEVIDALKCQIAGSRAQNDNSLGWLYFDSGGYSYAVRVKADRGKWVSASLQKKGPNGEMIEFGKNIGLPPDLPADATNCRVFPDHPAPDRPGEMPMGSAA